MKKFFILFLITGHPYCSVQTYNMQNEINHAYNFIKNHEKPLKLVLSLSHIKTDLTYQNLD